MKSCYSLLFFALGAVLIKSYAFSGFGTECSQNNAIHHITLNTKKTYQTVHNFGASDAWSIQYVGKYWPEESRQKIAQLLFSNDETKNGNSVGIGLSAWRFNIGGGSSEQGSDSGIEDEWRRAESFLEPDGDYNWTRQMGQQWFIKEAAAYGVEDFIGFVNSPPVHFTRNGKAWSEDGISSNLSPDYYEEYGEYLVDVIEGIHYLTGVELDYVSPFNEPQWDWKCCKQEGSPWNNNEIAQVSRVINEKLSVAGLQTKIDLTEAGQIDYLARKTNDLGKRSDQIYSFFHENSPNYLLDLSNVAPKVSGHSYWSTWSKENLVNSRKALRQKINDVDPSLEYWMSEYCLLEDNPEVRGNTRDLGIDPALYLARVIHADLVFANASAWHWWLAVSPYDYKDGLIYIDKNKQGGNVFDSKMLWALGHYSKFIKPGSKRIALENGDGNLITDNVNGLISSAYLTLEGSIVVVYVNQLGTDQIVEHDVLSSQHQKMDVYLTSANESDNLRRTDVMNPKEQLTIPARSLVTCVIK